MKEGVEGYPPFYNERREHGKCTPPSVGIADSSSLKSIHWIDFVRYREHAPPPASRGRSAGTARIKSGYFSHIFQYNQQIEIIFILAFQNHRILAILIRRSVSRDIKRQDQGSAWPEARMCGGSGQVLQSTAMGNCCRSKMSSSQTVLVCGLVQPCKCWL